MSNHPNHDHGGPFRPSHLGVESHSGPSYSEQPQGSTILPPLTTAFPTSDPPASIDLPNTTYLSSQPSTTVRTSTPFEPSYYQRAQQEAHSPYLNDPSNQWQHLSSETRYRSCPTYSSYNTASPSPADSGYRYPPTLDVPQDTRFQGTPSPNLPSHVGCSCTRTSRDLCPPHLAYPVADFDPFDFSPYPNPNSVGNVHLPNPLVPTAQSPNHNVPAYPVADFDPFDFSQYPDPNSEGNVYYHPYNPLDPTAQSPHHNLPKTKRKSMSGDRISTKDWVPPDVTGLSKREARLVKNRAAAFLSRRRKREEFEHMEIRVAELEQENARLQGLRSVQIRSQDKRQNSRHGRHHVDRETRLGDRQHYDSGSDRTRLWTPSSSTQEHVPTSQSSPLRILTPPDKLHPTLSCWIKNMNKLSSLIDRLQELASSAPAEYRSQLSRKVVALRARSKKQQEQFMEFLQLSGEYADKYLLDISAEIEQQSCFLEKLEGRLEAAKKLRQDAVDLQLFYESGTVATMENLRATALPRPLLEDQALFSEVDSVLAEIRRCYMELDKFWTEEISRAIEALKMRRVDPADFERWKNFRSNLKHTIESWKNEPPGGAQTLRRNDASEEGDIGAIASNLSSAAGSLTSALDRVHSSNSMKYSLLGPSSIEGVYVEFAANSDLCLSLLRRCVDYGEKLLTLCLPSIASPPSSRVCTIQERAMRLRPEMTGVPVGNASSVQDPRKFKSAYKKALSLEQKSVSGLNNLLEKLSSWVTVTDSDDHGLPDYALPDVVTLEQHRELWVKARDSVSAALATLKNEPSSQSIYRSDPLASTGPLSVVRRWMMNLVRFS